MTKKYKVLRKERLTWKGHSILMEIRMKTSFPSAYDIYVLVDNEIISKTSNKKTIDMLWKNAKERKIMPSEVRDIMHKKLNTNKTKGYFTHEGVRIPIEVELIFQEKLIPIPKNFQQIDEILRNKLSTVQNQKDVGSSEYEPGYSYFAATINGAKHVIGKTEIKRQRSYLALIGGLFFVILGIGTLQIGIREGDLSGISISMFVIIFGLICILGSGIKFRKPKN
ncbi:MAG: hypothetical protein ACQESB_07290 [Elusimicrobiota bacterium]